jgi:Putative DNA-binding domain
MMDFVDWCGVVLDKLIEEGRNPHIDEIRLAQILYGEETRTRGDFWHSSLRAGMLDAAKELAKVGLVELDGNFFKVTVEGRAFAKNPIPLWQQICETALEPEEERILRVVNQESAKVGSDPPHAWLQLIDREPLLKEFGIAPDMEMTRVLYPVAQDLTGRGFIFSQGRAGFHLDSKATYLGLVWQTRRGFTLESQFIDSLIEEWETTSVDFKREIHLDTADQRAEFIKDVLSLANTKASGRRWMMIGFDNRTRSYHSVPDPTVTQDRIEQILAHYTDPMVIVRYEVVQYRFGAVGKLEVLRDPTKLPYTVARSVGDKKRVEAGQVFVRHGSQIETPTPAELDSLIEEGRSARAHSS